jgi:hypothetical protein
VVSLQTQVPNACAKETAALRLPIVFEQSLAQRLIAIVNPVVTHMEASRAFIVIQAGDECIKELWILIVKRFPYRDSSPNERMVIRSYYTP